MRLCPSFFLLQPMTTCPAVVPNQWGGPSQIIINQGRIPLTYPQDNRMVVFVPLGTWIYFHSFMCKSLIFQASSALETKGEVALDV